MKKHISKEELERLYFEEKKSFSEIAEIHKCHAQTICNRFKEFNLKARTLSQALRGRDVKWKDKIAKALKGKKLPEEIKKKISEATKGRTPSNKGKYKCEDPENRAHWGMSSEKHWNWKGGVSKKNIRERQSSKYKHWRDKIFQRDNFTCQLCKKRGGELNAHHKKGFAEHKQHRYDIRNGVTLCIKCHQLVHKIKDKRFII